MKYSALFAKKILGVFILVGSAHFASAQSTSLKGSVVDTIEKKNLHFTVISLLDIKDSALVKFGRADKTGKFSISNLNEGEYIIMITHPYLGDYFDKITVKPNSVNDLGTINMIPKSKLLAEVIIRSGSPIRIKGDTTVYTADSFKVREGANVEELLRRLPGIRVEKDGKIIALGERVKKMLVDGEEFFGSDPGIATKNLRADIVKEVEVFDKKSEQAEFTGIDDGVKDRTINLKLKEDKKKGYFGKMEACGGLKDKYNNGVMLNAFRGTRKIAVYGAMNNAGQNYFNWEDQNNYSGGMETGINFEGAGNGIPRTWSGGFHYSNKFNNDKHNVNTNYRFSKINTPGVTTIFSKIFLPDTSWSTNSVSNNYSSVNRHAVSLIMEGPVDSNSTFKWTTRADKNNVLTRNDFFTESFTDNGDSLNNSRRNISNDATNDAIISSLLLRYKFKKPKRTLSVNTDLSWNRSKSDGLLYSLNNFYKSGVIDYSDTLDQQNILNSDSKRIITKVAYTEPLSKTMYLELNYSFSFSNNNNKRLINEKDGNGKYTMRIDSLSNLFEFNQLANTPGLNFRVNKKKYSYSFGSSVAFSHFKQNNLTDNFKYNYNYTNFFPRASIDYRIKTSSNLQFNYRGVTQAPTLEQLQPIRINTDPLNIYVGNPALNQAFNHNFDINYRSLNVMKERSLSGAVSLNFTQNAFSQFSSIDSVGRRIYQTVNTDGIYNIRFYGDYGFKIPNSEWRFVFNPNLSVNRNVEYLLRTDTSETVKNKTEIQNYGLGMNVTQYKPDKYNIAIAFNPSWNISRATVNSSANAEYWQIDGGIYGSLTFPGKIEIGSDISFQGRQKDKRFPSRNSFTTWNARLIKRFMKNNGLELKLAVYDMLNERRGYNRSFDSYSFTETYFNTLQRYWLLTIAWNFSKNPK